MRCTDDDCLAAIVEAFAVWDLIHDKRAPWDQGDWSRECVREAKYLGETFGFETLKGLLPKPGAAVHLDDEQWHFVAFLALSVRFAELAA
jgi:hypothetical protein